MGRILNRPDWVSLLIISAITAYGIFVSVTLNEAQVLEQLGYFFAGIGLVAVILTVDGIFFRALPPYFYVAAIVLLVVVYIFPEIRGSHRWIDFGIIRFQPSEMAKPFLMLAFSWLISVFSPRRKTNIIIHLIVFTLPFLLVFRQPDLGTSIVYFAVWLSMMIAGGLDLRYVLAAVLAIALIIPWGWGHLADYQKNRITSFINPDFDPRGTGYNAAQATIAVGSGQLFGRGLGFGTQSHLQFLPERHTDFIFASLVEEVGFTGGMLLIFLYLGLLYRLLLIVSRLSHDVFAFSFGIGLFFMILVQVFVNMGMNMGMLPITGITLPLVSYGGSSLISVLVAFGLFWAVGRPSESDRAIEIE